MHRSIPLPTNCRIVDLDGELFAAVADLDELRATFSDATRRKLLSGKPPLFSVVIPLFNEESNVELLHRRLVDVLGPFGEPYEILFVNDGSRDDTARRLERIQEESPRSARDPPEPEFRPPGGRVGGVGICQGRAVVLMDGDLQDPPEVLRPVHRAPGRQGYDVVYAVRPIARRGRPSDSATSSSTGS